MEIKGDMQRAQAYVWGDSVLLKQEKKSKFSVSSESMPYTVINRHRSRVTAIREDGRTITRNVSFFKKYKAKVENDSDDEDGFFIMTIGKAEATVQANSEPRYPMRQRRIP